MFTESYNMSVMNSPIPQHIDLAGNDTFPSLGNVDSLYYYMYPEVGRTPVRIGSMYRYVK